MTKSIPTSLLLLVVALSGVLVSASIERDPVRVTHRNSGPKYDIDEVERTRVPEQSESPQMPFARPQPEGSTERAPEDDGAQVGHISIRRIFLVPIGPSDGSSMWANGRHSAWGPSRPEDSGEESAERPSMFAGQTKPFWPFLMPSVPMGAEGHRPHLLGGDEASRPPVAEGASEREEGSPDRRTQMIDPMQLMINLMHQALSSAGQPGLLNDLSKGAQGANGTDTNSTDTIKPSSSESSRVGPSGDIERPIKPTSTNETREDIVEIEGKKYLRKTVINRHVGENIVFMTKRLIFMPLNETDSSVPTSTPANVPTSVEPQTGSSSEVTVASEKSTEPTNAPAQPSNAPEASEKAEELPASPTEVPASTSAPQAATEPSTAAPSSPEETTKGSLADRVSEAVERVAERLVERVGNEFSTSSSTAASTNAPAV